MRLAIGLLLAVLVNFGLFTLMQHMTSAKNIERPMLENIRILDFVRLKRDTTIETKKRELPKKPPPKKPPPPPKAPAPQANKLKSPTPKLDIPHIDMPLNIAGGPYLGEFSTGPKPAPAVIDFELDSEVIPRHKVPPRYPRSAARRGLEGVVTVSFTITATGEVRDPVVVNVKPESVKNVFNKATIKAILKWKFKPKVVDGQPVERQATQEVEFKLDK